MKRGTITVELVNGKKWTDVGAVLEETDSVYLTYNGKTRFYTGTRFVTNVSGGSYSVLNLVVNPFVYTMHAYGSVTYEDSTVRTCTYWISRRNTFNKSIPYTFTSDGDTTINGSLCTIGGTTRFGDKFLVQSPQAISANGSCGFDNPTSGIRILTSAGESVTVTYGVDALGNQVSGGTCAYGFMINWTKLSGLKGTAIISYN